tara:strand:- start:124 stop:432 length:309 start_codon:yes stop_codon:yes gene_type:complete
MNKINNMEFLMKNKSKWDEVYHIDNQSDVPPFFLANKLREMGYRANVYIRISCTNVWSDCGQKVADALLDLVHTYISYDEIDDYAECDIYEEVGDQDVKGGK